MSANQESSVSAEPFSGAPPAAFDERVRALMDEHDRSRAERLQTVAERMSGREAALAAFSRLKPLLLERLLRPRVQALVARFTNARATDGDAPEGVSIQVVFSRTDRFPVTATLRAGALLDTERGVVSVFAGVELVPMLVAPLRDTHRDVPFATLLGFADRTTPGATAETATDAEAEWDAVGAWLDERLLAFLAIYLATETDPAYQQMAMHVDPVCGMRLSTTSAAARREFRGHAYYLCSDACDARFVADPAYYVQRRRETLEA